MTTVIAELKRRDEQNANDILEVYESLTHIQETLAAHDGRFDGIDTRLEGIDTRLDGIDTQLSEVLGILRDQHGA
ncbi:MAG: hypothetical protein WA971_14240 [Microbacterium sp.]